MLAQHRKPVTTYFKSWDSWGLPDLLPQELKIPTKSIKLCTITTFWTWYFKYRGREVFQVLHAK